MDADVPGFVVNKLNARLFKGFLYLNDGREVSLHDSFALLDPLKRRQADSSRTCKLALAPAQKGPRRTNLRRILHQSGNVSDSISLDNNPIMSYIKS
jgi:hypothetical protein